MPTDPRFERALEEFFASERLSRRRFVGRAGSTGLALAGLSTAAGGLRVDRGHRGSGREEEVRAGRGQPPQDRDRRLDLLQLAALHRQEGPQGLQQEVRRQGQVRRGDQRQQRVLRQDPPAARAGPADRPRHHHADRLPGLPAGPAQLRRAAGQEEHPEPASTWSTTSRPSTTTRSARTRCRGSPGRSGIGYNIKKTGRELKNVKDLFDPKFKGRVTMLSEPYDSANTVLLGDGRRRVAGEDRPDPRRDREDRQGQPRRPVPPLHRQRLHDRPRQGQRVGLARLLGRPDPAAVRQPRPALLLLRGGRACSSPTT